ncbi:hypothetical protein C0V73_22385 [Rhizobium sp. TH135]|uniref:bifunctional diguanylate cyclase/phosphodiesterase n=1 Tax=Rhizobium sp. TH135 TaxID=2067451 RepID=UPI000C7BFDCA|nr:EAL domain-containing protein [Rhizobium sp. TH135]PLK68803.1 hypothetical protein C0V73_22385 [Rhizobium sp. TH135]
METAMRPYPIAANEGERLSALRELSLPKTGADASLDTLCRTAQELFAVPVALISLVEDDHQWFKSNCGLSLNQTSREVSFCAHAIQQDEVFVVSDATTDDRFCANPLVKGDPFIRFYAGAPISLTPGINVGTLCIIDRVTRSFSDSDREKLASLAQVVAALLQLTKVQSQLSGENRRKSAIFEKATAGLVIHDEHGGTLDCNTKAAHILGLTVEQVLGRSAVDPGWALIDEHEVPLPANETPAMRALSGPTTVRGQVVGIKTQGHETRWLRADAQVFTVEAGEKQVLVSFIDVTDEETARREAATAREMMATIIETIPDAIAAYDQNDRLLLCNAAYRDYYSASAPAIKIGERFEDILRYGLKAGQYRDAGNTHASHEVWLSTRLKRHRNPNRDTMIQHLDDGRWLQVRERKSPSGIIVGVRTDITAVKKAEEKVRLLADRDPLTGLLNRRSFMRQLQNAVNGRRPEDGLGAIAIVDLDHFKDLNDTLGHDSGDQFLQELSRRLQEGVRPLDKVARLGGDEFALLLPGLADRDLALQVVQRLMKTVTCPVQVSGKIIEPQMSIGVVSYPADGTEVFELLKNADIAMYESKKAGRNRVTVFDQVHRQAVSRRSYIAERLRQALRSDELEVALQAQVDMKTAQHVGFEALARWDLNGVPISASEFVAIADEFEMGSELDLQIMRKSLLAIRVLKDRGLTTGSVAVNMGARLLRNPQLPTIVNSALTEAHVSPHFLELEITEGVMMERGHEMIKTNLDALRDEGISIALDDFGTGYASLTHLTRFKVDKIKIDKSFVADVATSSGGDAIVRTLVLLAKSLGIRTVAEGVETNEQHRALTAYGCDVGQGYLFHRPQHQIEDVARYLEQFS